MSFFRNMKVKTKLLVLTMMSGKAFNSFIFILR